MGAGDANGIRRDARTRPDAQPDARWRATWRPRRPCRSTLHRPRGSSARRVSRSCWNRSPAHLRDECGETLQVGSAGQAPDSLEAEHDGGRGLPSLAHERNCPRAAARLGVSRRHRGSNASRIGISRHPSARNLDRFQSRAARDGNGTSLIVAPHAAGGSRRGNRASDRRSPEGGTRFVEQATSARTEGIGRPTDHRDEDLRLARSARSGWAARSVADSPTVRTPRVALPMRI